MRKYLAATALGLMLVAGQAAAYDSGVVNLGDRIGSQTTTAEDLQGNNTLLFALAAVLIIGLVSWAASQTNSGVPTSP